MTQPQQALSKTPVMLKRNGLFVECFPGRNGALERKIERYDRQFTEYTYYYDAKGHLIKVRCNGTLTEQYQYNPHGQRIEQQRVYRGFSDSTSGRLQYDEVGRLVRASDTSFYYNPHGSLAERCDCQGITKYFYGKDTMLDKVVLPSRTEIKYEYAQPNPKLPARRFRSGTLTAEFTWTSHLRLAAYRDHDNVLEYTFTYDASGILNKVHITPFRQEKPQNAPGTDWVAASSDRLGSFAAHNKRDRMHDFLGKHSLPLELLCGCDQVGTVKLLTDKSGRIVKEVLRDSFGVQYGDSFPDLFMPIGFAGGLTDPDNGFVRFGYRDYDPSVGRFTALDPAKDRRGDGDLYDYCVDDPVNAIDPTGLMGCRPQFRVDEDQRMQTPPPAQTPALVQQPTQTPTQPARPQVVAQQQPEAATPRTLAPAPVVEQQPAQDNRPGIQRWTYNQRTGQLRDPNGNIIETGYSGAPGYVNSFDAERRRGEGPIPVGWYRIGETFNSVRTGAHSIRLVPDGHDAHGRTAFQMHADNPRRPPRSSSQGCPIFTLSTRQRVTSSQRQGIQMLRVVNEPEW